MDRVLPRFLMGPLIFQKTSRLIPNTVSNSWHLQHVKATKKDNREHTTIDQAGFIFALQQERTHVPECRGVRKDMGGVETADWSESLSEEVSGIVRGLIFRIWTCAELWSGFIASR